MRQFLLLLSLFFFVGCGDAPVDVSTGPGIYYWKTRWEMTAADQAALRAAGARQLFLRLFDVDWDFKQEVSRPKGLLQLPDSLIIDNGLQLTPVVFIVERVFRQAVDVEDLAERVGRTISGVAHGHAALRAAKRWQIDCDWTPVSRDRYFAFLRALQRQYPDVTVNVTVRLHQYRERVENGVPPVSEGLLMCYNMQPVGKRETINAIYREDLLQGYLKAPPYPFPLDAGLPVFDWGAAFRDELFLGIVPSPKAVPGFLEPAVAGHFLVLRDTTLLETFVRAGDEIRYDGAEANALLSAAALLRARPEIRDLLLFDWRVDVLEKWPVEEVWRGL